MEKKHKNVEAVEQREMHTYGMEVFLSESSWGPATSSPDWELHSTGTLSVYSSMDTVKGNHTKSLKDIQ